MYRNYWKAGLVALVVIACSPSKQIEKSARKNVLQNESLRAAHVGITIYDPVAGRYLYNYQGDKYFVPASNTKLPTCYAAMKFLGDSLPGLNVTEYKNSMVVRATGDPTLLHPDFRSQPVYDFLKSTDKMVEMQLGRWNDHAWGAGWSWSDYDADYLAERSALPVYGNVITIKGTADSPVVMPAFFQSLVVKGSETRGYINNVQRELMQNRFTVSGNAASPRSVQVPFITSGEISVQLLMDSLHTHLTYIPPGNAPAINFAEDKPATYTIHSQPTDSLLRIMMHRSDNFFAEQTLLMVSNVVLGQMNDARIIDTLLKTDLKDLPQKPRWVDGSGLSRYNIFTPQDMVAILGKMRNEFGMDRVKNILATGNDGTLTNYYKADSGYIYAKTGTLSGVVAISGFIYTRKNKLLIFSVLVNNHQASATVIRRAVEKFISGLREEKL